MFGSSESQKTTSELLHLAFGGSSYSQGTLTLTSGEIQDLLSRSSSDEQKDIDNALKECTNLVPLESRIPRTALVVGGMYLAYTKLVPAMFNYRPKKMWPFYVAASALVGGSELRNALEVKECRNRVKPKITNLWMKYGADKSTADYATLAGLVPEKTSMPVATEQRANVDDFTTTSELLRSFGPLSVFQGEVRLSADKIEQLLSRSSSGELKEIHDTLVEYYNNKDYMHRLLNVPFALVLGFVFAALKFPALKKRPFPLTMCAGVVFCEGSFLAKLFAEHTRCMIRLEPKIAKLWLKYGDAESTAKYQNQLNRYPGEDTAGLVTEKTSIPVISEQRGNVDNTYASRMRYSARQRQDDFGYSDTFISGTPSGSPRERLEKNQTKTNVYGDNGLS